MEQDTNGDKVIDDKDANYSRLQVWQDANQMVFLKRRAAVYHKVDSHAIQLNLSKSQLGGHEEVIFGNSAKFIKANGETGMLPNIGLRREVTILRYSMILLFRWKSFLPNVAGSE